MLNLKINKIYDDFHFEGKTNGDYKSLSILNKDELKTFVFYKSDWSNVYSSLFNNFNDWYSIYFLINENNTNKSIYIGQTKSINNRIQNHNNNKEYSKSIIISSLKWTSSHIDFFEYYFIDFFTKHDAFLVENKKIEHYPRLTLHDEDKIKNDFELIQKLLLIEGIDLYKISKFVLNKTNSDEKIIPNLLSSDNNAFKLKSDYEVFFNNIKAHFYVNNKNNEAIKLYKGTIIKYNEFDISKYNNELTKNQIFRYIEWFKNNSNIRQISLNNYELINDIYLSPSFSACLVGGRFSINGKDCWKTQEGRTLNNLERENE